MSIPTDKDLFPCGAKFKGKPYGKVPAWYLDWCRDQQWIEEKYPQVIAYINANAAAIDKELK
jgi:hypothetical protein